MRHFFSHLHTINQHKIKVTLLCFRCGLYKQGLLHDLSKYSFVEMKTGVKYFQGNRSPIEREKEITGYSMGWFHHKGRNKHHWEYWLDNAPNGVKPVAMPMRYVIEMFCDRIAASMIYQKEQYRDDSAYIYYMNGRKHILIHPDTDALIVDLLTQLKEHGLDYAISYAKEVKRKHG